MKSAKKKILSLTVICAMICTFGCGSSEEAKELLITDMPDFEDMVSQMQERASATATNEEAGYENEGYGSETYDDAHETEEETTTVETVTSMEIATSEEETTTEKETTTIETTTIETTTIEATTIKDTTTAKPTTTVKETTTAKETTTVKDATTAKPTTTAKETTTGKETVTAKPTTTQPTTSAPTSTVGGAFKEFSVSTLDGQTFTQEVFSKADVNVVIIWTTWCGYCKMEMPALQKVMEKYAGESIQFFSLVCDVGTYATEEEATQLLSDKGVTFTCMIRNDSINDGYMESISGYPKTLYLNREGQIMYEVGGAYAGYGEDYAIECHSYFVDFFLKNPDYLP